MISTRSLANDAIFGAPKDFTGSNLPTYEDLMKCYLWIRHEQKSRDSKKEPTISTITCELVPKLCAIWEKASIPVISVSRINFLVHQYHDKYKRLLPTKGQIGKCCLSK